MEKVLGIPLYQSLGIFTSNLELEFIMNYRMNLVSHGSELFKMNT